MNRYHESMEHCAPPPELEEQLREAVLSAEPELRPGPPSTAPGDFSERRCWLRCWLLY